jgi:hypothetical protein
MSKIETSRVELRDADGSPIHGVDINTMSRMISCRSRLYCSTPAAANLSTEDVSCSVGSVSTATKRKPRHS